MNKSEQKGSDSVDSSASEPIRIWEVDYMNLGVAENGEAQRYRDGGNNAISERIVSEHVQGLNLDLCVRNVCECGVVQMGVNIGTVAVSNSGVLHVKGVRFLNH